MNNQKLHRNLIEAVISALQQIFEEKKYADRVIEKLLSSNKRWGARDRAFIAETTYEMVRWWRLLWELKGTPQSLEKEDLLELFGIWWLSTGRELPPWDQFKNLNPNQIKNRYEKLRTRREIKESIPDWLDSLGSKELGKLWDKELHALNDEAHVVLRVNLLKTDRKNLATLLLDEEEIETEFIEATPEALLLKERQNIFRNKFFKEGFFEVQDASSQRVGHYVDVKPGMRVIDACAGAGGKSLHLAALMQNKGKIISMDTVEWKLQQLKLRARRAGVSIIETRLIDSGKVIKRLEESADRVLLDVPCSGLGVLKRNPDAKWKLTPEFIDEVKKTQQDILTGYSKMVKKGGKLIYSTCSILPSENHLQVQKFLDANAGFELESEEVISPAQSGFDGFYMASLIKK